MDNSLTTKRSHTQSLTTKSFYLSISNYLLFWITLTKRWNRCFISCKATQIVYTFELLSTRYHPFILLSSVIVVLQVQPKKQLWFFFLSYFSFHSFGLFLQMQVNFFRIPYDLWILPDYDYQSVQVWDENWLRHG